MKMIKTVKMRLRALSYRLFKSRQQMVSAFALIGDDVILEGRNSVGDHAVLDNVSVGYGTYIGDNVSLTGCKVGRFCSVGPNVQLIRGRHPMHFVSMHPAFYSPDHPCRLSFVEKRSFDDYRYAQGEYNVVIGSDVWLGKGAAVMDGVTIGNGAVIAAGALVTKDVPDYAVVGGVPAKLIKYRFPEETVEKLKQSAWWDRDIQWIRDHAACFENVDAFIRLMEEENG